MMLTPLYFAYGSNTLTSRINSRIGECRVIGTYSLPGYNLVFNTGYRPKYPYANIIPDIGGVEGVLYKLNDEQIYTLDRYEGYPSNYQKFYFMNNGRLIYGYWSTDPAFVVQGIPLHEYLCFCIDGAIEHKLIRTYNKLVNYEQKNYKRKSKFRVRHDFNQRTEKEIIQDGSKTFPRTVLS